ncbi:hypothetical protein HQN89_10800 [Paenibacillus frigoriresistens]|uniref:hypothetical protein n=1 Tax=Paenibacillus alginolyticus TaxID=59839 RepID=UPI00156742F8|nr:hypothetical protein [Paenibacillus frigoriresistens]NRF91507.1 hypothetical protein [Paenibacillus frigoriresistens]
MQGWVKLYRDILESKTFQKLSAIQKLIAIYIVLNANHKDGLWFDQYKGVEVPVKRGQLITSRKKIVEEWFKNDKDVSEQKVRTTLAKLSNLGFLTIESTNWYTLITVVKYEVYQGDDDEVNQPINQDLTSNQPALNQHLTTNKNVKNVKKEKIIYAEFVTMTDEEHEKLVIAHGEEKTKRMIEILNSYKGSNGKKYKSDYLAILNWVVERVNQKPSQRQQVASKQMSGFDKEVAFQNFVREGGDPADFRYTE